MNHSEDRFSFSPADCYKTYYEHSRTARRMAASPLRPPFTQISCQRRLATMMAATAMTAADPAIPKYT